MTCLYVRSNAGTGGGIGGIGGIGGSGGDIDLLPYVRGNERTGGSVLYIYFVRK